MAIPTLLNITNLWGMKGIFKKPDIISMISTHCFLKKIQCGKALNRNEIYHTVIGMYKYEFVSIDLNMV